MSAFAILKKELDKKDRLILAELVQNARISYSELSRRVNLSAPAVIERIQRMEDQGVINGYQTLVDQEKLGYPIQALVRVSVSNENQSRARNEINRIPEITEAFFTTGDAYLHIKLTVTSTSHLQKVLDRILRFGDTSTCLILEKAVERHVEISHLNHH